MLQLIKKLYLNEDGQGLVEYSIILGFIALIVIVSIMGIGPKVETKYVSVQAAFD